ncbi:MAG: zinc ribbon domain-containing protein [Nitrospirota bacterium]
MVCKQCTAPISDTAKFCPKCGAKTEAAVPSSSEGNARKCPQCQTAYPLGTKFCKKDGTPLQPQVAVTASHPTEKEATKEAPKPEPIVQTPIEMPKPASVTSTVPPKPEFKKTEAPSQPTPAFPQESKSSKKGLLVAVAAIVILAASGVAGYFFFMNKKDGGAQTETKEVVSSKSVEAPAQKIEEKAASQTDEGKNVNKTASQPAPAASQKPQHEQKGKDYVASYTKSQPKAPSGTAHDKRQGGPNLSLSEQISLINKDLIAAGFIDNAKAREKDGSIIIKGAVRSVIEKERILGIVAKYTRNYKDSIFIINVE